MIHSNVEILTKMKPVPQYEYIIQEKRKQAGAELGQAQLKLGLDFTENKIYGIELTCRKYNWRVDCYQPLIALPELANPTMRYPYPPHQNLPNYN